MSGSHDHSLKTHIAVLKGFSTIHCTEAANLIPRTDVWAVLTNGLGSPWLCVPSSPPLSSFSLSLSLPLPAALQLYPGSNNSTLLTLILILILTLTLTLIMIEPNPNPYPFKEFVQTMINARPTYLGEGKSLNAKT